MGMEEAIRDALAEMDKKNEQRHRAVMKILEGSHDELGAWHPGLAPKLVTLEGRVAKMEAADPVTAIPELKRRLDERDSEEKQALTVKQGLALSGITMLLTKALDYITSHIK